MKRTRIVNNKLVYRAVLFFLPFYLFTFLPLKAQTSVAGLFSLEKKWSFGLEL